MCLLAFAWRTHPRYRFVFAGNRDEFHSRPAAQAGWWPDAPDVFGGRDLEAGGSWLGLRRDARFAVVTNFREPDRRPAGKRSRGELVTRFLAGDMSADEYLDFLHEHADDYAGFNLLFADLSDDNAFHYFSNRDHRPVALGPGVHALSNHLLDTPWPKVRRLRAAFVAELDNDEPSVDALLDMLADTRPAEDDELPATGLSPEWERRLSAPKIVGPEYGTRASTVILVGSDGSMQFVERSFRANGAVDAEVRQHF